MTSIGAFAVRRSEPDQPLLADSLDTLHKVIALRWIAEWAPVPASRGDAVRAALLAENWSEALLQWMEATDEVVDVYPYGPPVHLAEEYADEEFGPRIQTCPLFRLG